MYSLKITFIIPVYNAARYLHKCLDSIVNQTLREIQIICINDGSTDESGVILNEYAARDERMCVINLPNGGQSIARNSAYEYVKGEYIFFIDADDFIDLDTAKKLYTHALQNDVDIVLFDVYYCNEKLVPYKSTQKLQKPIIIDSFEQRTKLILDSRGMACDKLYRRDFLLQNQIKCPEKLYGQDQAVTFLSLAAANKIMIVPEPLYYYRMVASSISHSYNKNKRQTDTIAVYAFIRDELIRLGLFETFQEVFSIRKLHVFYRHFRRATYLSEKERINIFRSNISENDIKYFKKNQHEFKKNQKRILSCIIENKPLPLIDKILTRLVGLTSIVDSIKMFLRCRKPKK
jgi:glycosyltransferase involved in cell wall biosynthesis